MKNWQRWLGGLVLTAGLMLGVNKALKAQLQTGGPNYVQQLSAYLIGAPQVLLNGAGSNWGQIGNASGANSATRWFLGFGSTLSAIGTEVLSWTTGGAAVMNVASDALVSGNLLQVNVPAANNSEYYLAYLTNGWLEFHSQPAAISGSVAASVPTAGNCGASSSAAIGTDVAGDVSVGSSPGNSCDITFASIPDNIPHCICNDSTSVTAGCVVTNVSKSGFNMNAMKPTLGNGTDVFVAGDRLDWLCFGHQ